MTANLTVKLANLLTEVNSRYGSYPIDIIVDEVIELSDKIWGTYEGYQASNILFTICKEMGHKLTQEQVKNLVIRDNNYSRTGINALGFLYDEFPHYIKSLGLIEIFCKTGVPEPVYYCKLRERYLEVKSTNIIFNNTIDYEIDGLTVTPEILEELPNKWANRGDSAILDYLISIGPWESLLFKT